MRNYRGKTKDGEWVEGNLLTVHARCFIIPVEWYGMYGWYRDDTLHMHWLEVLPSTVGQSTGRKDKNGKGKEVFAGDTCKANYFCPVGFDTAPHELIGTIEWDEADLCWVFDYGHGTMPMATEELADLEIIDNVHDNPELLEGGQ